MKTILLCLLLGATGCASTNKNLEKIIAQLKNDPATVNLRVVSVYGTVTFTRTAPTTNSLPHTILPDGTVEVGSKK